MNQVSPQFEAAQSMLEKMLQKLLKKNGVQHVALGVESGNGEFKWVGAAGKARHEGGEMTIQTPFMIASVTKLFIAAGIFILVERKKIDLDKPAAKYLPGKYMDGLHILKGTDYSQKISIRHLLSHSSGIPDWLVDKPSGGKSMVDHIGIEEDREITILDLLDQVKNNLKPRFSPADFSKNKIKIRYSDTNFQLLIAILEHQCGKQIGEVFQEFFYQPLGLENTFHPEGDEMEGRGGADFWVAKKPFKKPLLTASFRDLYSTSDDLLAFMKALISGSLFQDPHTSELMRSSWNQFSFPLDSAALRLPSWPIQYGMGMMRWKLPRLYSPFSNIPAVVGHTGVTGSWLFYCSEYDLYLCGSVSQLFQAPLPFRWVPQVLNRPEIKNLSI
ncbi:MAG: class A beta-lactamase-related serine hydrolase [Saprospirales bacterium]|nr:MAG: class A beta-lactamase-related serine hydrolase [Saprospirales bacterium]